MLKFPGRYLLFYFQLWLSVEHHGWININALPHSEACLFWFDFALICADRTVSRHDREPKF